MDSKEFFIAPYLTNIGFDEILVSIKFPEINKHTKLGLTNMQGGLEIMQLRCVYQN